MPQVVRIFLDGARFRCDTQLPVSTTVFLLESVKLQFILNGGRSRAEGNVEAALSDLKRPLEVKKLA